MQQTPLDLQPLSVAHAESSSGPVDRESQSGTSEQNSALPDTESRSSQYQTCHSSQAAQDACSAQDIRSTSTSLPHRVDQADMDTSPSTPPGRGIAPSNRPPDAPRKPKQARPPIQLSPNAPVRKLDFDSSLFQMQSSSDSEQSCNSRHSGPGRG